VRRKFQSTDRALETRIFLLVRPSLRPCTYVEKIEADLSYESGVRTARFAGDDHHLQANDSRIDSKSRWLHGIQFSHRQRQCLCLCLCLSLAAAAAADDADDHDDDEHAVTRGNDKPDPGISHNNNNNNNDDIVAAQPLREFTQFTR